MVCAPGSGLCAPCGPYPPASWVFSLRRDRQRQNLKVRQMPRRVEKSHTASASTAAVLQPFAKRLGCCRSRAKCLNAQKQGRFPASRPGIMRANQSFWQGKCLSIHSEEAEASPFYQEKIRMKTVTKLCFLGYGSCDDLFHLVLRR